jgi:glyoxylase-like metal-dependent hydrolase (beta-lactamase superfamily II)
MNQPITGNSDQTTKAVVTPFFDEPTNTLSYVVQDPGSAACAIVDCVMNLDYPSGTLSFEGADAIIAFIESAQLDLQWILETHVHADHVSAAPYIKSKLGGKIAIGNQITVVQETFGAIFEAGPEFARDGSQFDVLLADNDPIAIGGMHGTALHTPGHTPACMTYVLGDAVFVGDTLFMPDGGTARADFPGGDAGILFQSIHRILSLPDTLRVFVCHDYLPDGRELEFETTIGEERERNIHVKTGITEQNFVAMRESRDQTLGMPSLILPSLQINMRAGHLPPASSDGGLFLKLPINAFGGPNLDAVKS